MGAIADRVLTLADLRDPKRFVCLGWVPWFDEHEQYDANGELVRKVDRTWLEELCRNNNERGETGDFTAFGPGHTIPNYRDGEGRLVVIPEGDQPPHWGYMAGWEVRPLRDGTLAAGATRFVRHEVELPTSKGTQRLRGPQAVDSFPWRSIEYSATKHDAPYGALLRRPPERNIGATVSYARGAETILRGGTPLRCSTRRRARAAVQWGDRLYFSMEMNVDDIIDPSKAPDAKALTPEEKDHFMRCARECYPNLDKMHGEATERYSADTANPAAMAGPTNTSMPGPDKKPDDKPLDQFSRDTKRIVDANASADLAALRAEVEKFKGEARTARAQSRIKQLVAERIKIDPIAELARYERCDEKTWDDEDEYRRQHYQRRDEAPVDFVDLGEPDLEQFSRGSGPANAGPSMDRVKRAKQLMYQKGYEGEAGWEKALAETK